jgi:6-carboxyhexanoate--CoA ligase
MRAAQGGSHEEGGSHISGGERLVPVEQVEATVQKLMRRALSHELGRPDFINVTVELVPADAVRGITALPMSKREALNLDEGRRVAIELLQQVGISESVARLAIETIANGPAPDGGAMRGAIVMDADTGERLEIDQARGVRVSQLDWHPETLAQWQDVVREYGLASERIAEALALATKVVQTPGTVAELCWSDDPSYVTGYVAARELGYVRIPHLKERGSSLGGRVYFVRGIEEIETYYERLQSPILINGLPAPMYQEDGRESVTIDNL